MNSENIDNALRNSRRVINHVSLGTNFFIRHWKERDRERLTRHVDCKADFYNIYDLENLSFSYFIANLIDITCGGLRDRYWFSFPIEGTKELLRIRTVCLD